jgi:chromosome segregation ATPase
MIYIGEDNISDLNDFLEASGKIKEINNFDDKIINYETELNALESDRNDSQLNISKAEEKLQELRENLKGSNNGVQTKIEKGDAELKKLLKNQSNLDNIISEKTIERDELQTERDELVKKSLMILHSTMKKEHQKADKEHARYVELYTQERAKKHDLERKMMNLKMMVYKSYGLRLI